MSPRAKGIAAGKLADKMEQYEPLALGGTAAVAIPLVALLVSKLMGGGSQAPQQVPQQMINTRTNPYSALLAMRR